MTPEQRALAKRIAEATWDTIEFNGPTIYDNVRWRVVTSIDGLFHWVWTQQYLASMLHPNGTRAVTTQPYDSTAPIMIAGQTFCGMAFEAGDWRIALPNCIKCMTRPYG